MSKTQEACETTQLSQNKASACEGWVQWTPSGQVTDTPPERVHSNLYELRNNLDIESRLRSVLS